MYTLFVRASWIVIAKQSDTKISWLLKVNHLANSKSYVMLLVLGFCLAGSEQVALIISRNSTLI